MKSWNGRRKRVEINEWEDGRGTGVQGGTYGERGEAEDWGGNEKGDKEKGARAGGGLLLPRWWPGQGRKGSLEGGGRVYKPVEMH